MRRSVSIIVWLLIGAAATANAADIKFLAPIALKPVLSDLIPQFEKSSGNAVAVEYGLIGALTSRLAKDEVADVAILADGQIGDLEKQGKIVAGSRIGVAKLGLGAFIRKDSSKLNLGSADAFKQTLITAKTIAYVDPATGAPSGTYMAKLIDRLGIAEQMKAKTKLTAPEKPLFDAVVGGDADIGFTLISEIVAEPAVDLAGPLPPDIQNNVPYAAGLVVAGKQQDGGKALIAFLTSPSSLTVMKAKGFEPF